MAADDQFIRGAGMLAVLKVLEGGELVGMLTRGDVINQLEVRVQFSERG
mgnify:CR=1 FL=1